MNLKDELAESGDVYLRDIELFLMCLFKDVPNGGVVCDELEWNSEKGGAKILIPVIGSTRSKEGELTCKRCVL